MDNYFNTTEKTGQELESAVSRASGQSKEILEIFEKNPEKDLTPWEVMAIHGNIMITSVRRSMTVLTAGGFLEKTDKRRRSGPAMETSFTWRLLKK